MVEELGNKSNVLQSHEWNVICERVHIGCAMRHSVSMNKSQCVFSRRDRYHPRFYSGPRQTDIN